MASIRTLLLALGPLLCAAEPHKVPGSSPVDCARGGLDDGATSECADEGEAAMPVNLLQQELLLSSKPLSLEQRSGLREQAGLRDAASEDSVASGELEATSTTTTTPPPTGLSLNAAGDLKTFITSLIMYYGATTFCFFFFSFMRLRYPIMYQYNIDEGVAPYQLPNTFWGWYPTSRAITIDEIAQYITLDHAQLIEYARLCMQIMAIIGMPMFFVIGPLNWGCGGLAAGPDHLSYLSFGNVENGSWLYWLHSFVVWGVVVYSTFAVHQSYREFLPRRFKWLHEMSHIRANTVLVDGIPEDCRSDTKVREMFEELLPGTKITKVEMMKDVTALSAMESAYATAKLALRKAEVELENHPDHVPMVRESFMGTKVEAIPYWKNIVETLEPQMKAEKARILEETHTVGGVNLSNAFVTFEQRVFAELALHMDATITDDIDEWGIMSAPDPTDVLWGDLTQDDVARTARAVIGYMLIVVLIFAYLPIVIAVTNLGKAVDLSKIGLGALQSVWDGVAPTIGLQFMVAMLPTFLIMIMRAFFTCRCELVQQHKLQIWYFWFQVIFVLLATAVGQNFRSFAMTVLTDPMGILPVLAKTLPSATHYYMNYLVLQAMAAGMEFTRYFPFLKYKGFLALFEEKEAKEMAEPEDQDYYGMGSRSARWTIMLGIGIIFGTLCPPMSILCFLNFFVCRVAYGYLFMFAETKKADTGGRFFVTQLTQLFPILIIYVLLMSAVFYRRATSIGPCVISATSLVWILISLNKLQHYSWENLPLQELHEGKTSRRRPDQGMYEQPEMLAK